MSIVADESVDSGIVKKLRQKGISVFSVAEKCWGIKDTEVLKIAFERDNLLITEDKDFGELAFRMNFQHRGILL